MDTDCFYADLLYQQLHIPTNILNSMHKTSYGMLCMLEHMACL